MESLEIDDTFKGINSETESIDSKDINKSEVYIIREKSLISKIKLKFMNIPYIIFPAIITFLVFLIYLFLYIAFISKYKISYNYEENAYVKPKYSTHEYSSITFENGLKLVLVQVDSDDEAGGVISFDFGYLNNEYEPGYMKLAFLSLINDNISKPENLTNYLGKFNYVVDKYYSSFYFNILGGGFKEYLKLFSALTYLKENDDRFNHIGEKDLNYGNNAEERKNHILEYLIYGYNDSKGRDIIPQGTNEIKENLKGNYTSIINIMKIILSDPSKIKIVLYSHYKMSIMKKLFLNHFSELVNKPKKNNNNINQLNEYNGHNRLNTNKIIYYRVYNDENFLEINYFLNDENNTYNQFIKDSQYLIYITYILNQTDENSLYYKLNHGDNNISINSIESGYEIILKSKIKFNILIQLNHYSYKYISYVISKVYNYMNNIKLYINSYKDILNDVRIEELEIISGQNFTFTEDAHESHFFQNIAKELFYKDEKDFLLKQMWFSKNNFCDNIYKVKYYYDQFNVNNSVILLGVSDKVKSKYNLSKSGSDINYLFKKTKMTSYMNLIYTINNIDEHLKIDYDENFTMLLNPNKNDYISKFNLESNLDYDANDYEKYFTDSFEEINDFSDNYLKIFLKRDTSFHIPKAYITTYFFHPFFRPNFRNYSNIKNIYNNTNNDKLYFNILLYMAYIQRAISEKLSDVFRAGGNFFKLNHNENFFYLDLFLFSDQVLKILNVIKNIIYDKTAFISELKEKFEIYRDIAIEDFLKFGRCSNFIKLKNTFFETITKDQNNIKPPIYNYCNFPIDSFIDINLNDIKLDIIELDLFTIKHIFIFGYYNKSEAYEIYKLFNSTNNFILPLIKSNFTWSDTNDSNFVSWITVKPIPYKNFRTTCNINKYKTIRFIYFKEYNLEVECLTQILTDILSKDKNLIKNDISIELLNQKSVYLLFYFNNETINNEEFIKNLKKWLEEHKEMEEDVDIIGDKFYYVFKGIKKVISLKHNNMIDCGVKSSYSKLYHNEDNNNDLNFSMENYQEFVKYFDDNLNPETYFVEITTKS